MKSYENQILHGKDFSNQNLENISFRNSDLTGSDFRQANLNGADIRGANLFGCRLENATLNNIKFDETTKYFALRCPEVGAFLAYKKCFDNRIVRLLIPKDAIRTSSTYTTCRCNKAKVLSIQSFDGKTNYKEASSYVDDNFIYKVGEYVFADNFNKDRWVDSTTGIHFFMTIEEAKGYL